MRLGNARIRAGDDREQAEDAEMGLSEGPEASSSIFIRRVLFAYFGGDRGLDTYNSKPRQIRQFGFTATEQATILRKTQWQQRPISSSMDSACSRICRLWSSAFPA